MFSTLLLMEIYVNPCDHTDLDYITLEKMKFIYNALDSGWSVVKKGDNYIFNKKHEGDQEIYLETYLQKFIQTNITKLQ